MSEDKKTQDNTDNIQTDVTLYGSGNKTGSSLNVVADFQGFMTKLKGMDDDPLTKIPKNQKDSILEMKDKQLGSLKSQFYFLKAQKKTDFKNFYSEEIEKIKEKRQTQVDNMNETLDVTKDELEIEIRDMIGKFVMQKKSLVVNEVEGFKLKGSLPSALNKEDFDIAKYVKGRLSYNNEDFFNVRYSLPEIPFDDIVEKIFFLEYDPKFKEIFFRLETLEKQFEEALNFNLMITAMKTYQELKKADFFLNKISKMEIVKYDINFWDYTDKKAYEKLCQEYEMAQVVTINPNQ